MNLAIIIGRMTRDPEMRTTANQIPVASFTIAVDRQFKNANGDREADFINCVAWRKEAEFVSKYFFKGSKIAVTGSIQTRKWEDNDGNNRTATEIVVDHAEFVESKLQDSQHVSKPQEEKTVKPVSEESEVDENGFQLPFDL